MRWSVRNGIVGIPYPIDKVKEEFEAAEETRMQIAPLVGDDADSRTPTAFFLSEDGGAAIALPMRRTRTASVVSPGRTDHPARETSR